MVSVWSRATGLGVRVEEDLREPIGHARGHKSGLPGSQIFNNCQQAVFRVLDCDSQGVPRIHQKGLARHNGKLVWIIVEWIAGSLGFAIERKKCKRSGFQPHFVLAVLVIGNRSWEAYALDAEAVDMKCHSV